MDSEKVKLGQTKICVQKNLKKHDDHLRNISHSGKLRAAFLKEFLWKSGDIIKIGFMDNGNNVPRNTYVGLSNSVDIEGHSLKVDPLQKEVDSMSVIDGIKTIVNKRLQPIVGLSFVFVDDYKTADVRVSFDKTDGAWSLVGTQCQDPENKDKATMNLGWFDVATTTHEFGHVLGLIHEHQNSDENPIKWDKEAVYKWASSDQGWDKQTTDTNILSTYNKTEINGSIFDPLSIMLYFFPPELTTNNQGTRQNLRLSGYDVKYLNQVYPNSSETPENFYLQTYGQTLEQNIKESTKDLTNPYPVLKPSILPYVLLGIGILVIILLVVLIIRKGK
jgi:hypothetical protein